MENGNRASALAAKRRRSAKAIGGLLAFALALATAGASMAGDRGALWRVVRLCAANHAVTGAAFPCLAVEDQGGDESGYVVLRPPFGAPDTVLSPLRRIVGAEDPWLLSPRAANYFAAARNALGFVEGSGGRDLAIAVNSKWGRAQDQLHLHLGCLEPRLDNVLRSEAARLPTHVWSRALARRFGADLWLYRADGEALADIDPFRLVGEGPVMTRQDRERTTIALVELPIAGRREFVVLASRADVLHPALTAEEVVDVACAARG